MKKIYIIANWKSNSTQSQAYHWFAGAKDSMQTTFLEELKMENKEVVLCVSFTLFSEVKSLIASSKLPIEIGGQDISPFDEGAYTGEVNGQQIKEFADYVIIGHLERRKYFGETDEIVFKKFSKAAEYGLISIICISELSQISNLKSQIEKSNLKISDNLIIAYEPPAAVFSGIPDDPRKADQKARDFKKQLDVPVLYGGSVTSKNISDFTKMPNIDGVLAGKASLNPFEFFDIIKNA